MKVKDLPMSLQEACVERGFVPDAEISPRQACMEWTGWHFGDPFWGGKIIDMYNEATVLQNRENAKK